MSNFDLHEFNILSKRNNYFMTDNRINGIPLLNENSILLKKILLNRSSNSSDKRLDKDNSNNSNLKPKKFVHFEKPESIIYKSPIIKKTIANNSKENFHNKRYQYILFNNKIQNIKTNSDYKINISPYRKNRLLLDKSINRHNYYRISLNNINKKQNTPDNYSKHTRFNSNSNIIDYDNDLLILSYKGKKLFSSNYFGSFKNIEVNNFEEKKENINSINIRRSELFRNSKELKKKKEEIFLRKMKRESSALRKEMLRKEKDKDIKVQKISIEINSNNNSRKNSNNNIMRIIPINKEFNDLKKITYRLITYDNNLKKKNSYNMVVKNANKISLNNQPGFINIRGINKNINNDLSHSNEASKNDKEKDKYLSNNNNNNESIIANNNFKSNNIYFSKFSECNPLKNNRAININNKIKENLELFRKSQKSENENDIKQKAIDDKNKSISPDKHNNPYRFMISKKKFFEDYIQDTPTIFSNDKKISIKIHTLQNLNEVFLGKKQTREKLRMQRVISVILKVNIGNRRSFNYFNSYKNTKKIKEIKPLITINKSKEKFKAEANQRILNTEQKLEEVIENKHKFVILQTEAKMDAKKHKPQFRRFKNERKYEIIEEKSKSDIIKIEQKKDVKEPRLEYRQFKAEQKNEEKEQKENINILQKEQKNKVKEYKTKYRRYGKEQKKEVKEEKSQSDKIKTEKIIKFKECKQKCGIRDGQKIEIKEEKQKSDIKIEKSTESKEKLPLGNSIKRKYFRRFEKKK